jgi:hypothetical protein
MRVVKEPETSAGPHGDVSAELAADELAGLRFFEGVPGGGRASVWRGRPRRGG